MNWDGLKDDDDDDHFYESRERASSAMSADLEASSSEEDDFDDCRISFTSAVSTTEFGNFAGATAFSSPISPDYDIWMAAPGSITERRKRLLQGMGLTGDKEIASSKRITSIKKQPENDKSDSPASTGGSEDKQENSPSTSSLPIVLIRSRSEGDIESFSVDRNRKEELIGRISKQRLTRTYSAILTPNCRMCPYPDSIRVSPKETGGESGRSIRNGAALTSMVSNTRFGAFFLIKNLDTGKEFIVNEYNEDGMWNRLSDLQTGKQLTMEEFEKCVGYSPVVKELMRRENISRINGEGGHERKVGANYLSKSLRMSKRRGVALLKNSIKGVANSMSGLIGEKEREIHSPEQKPCKNSGGSSSPSSEWIKVRQCGKSYKELSALHLCQEIQAHEGSIWTIRFNTDARFLASAGEDRVIHVWEVQECEVMSLREVADGGTTPLHPSLCACPDRSPSISLGGDGCDKKKKGKGGSSRKTSPIPDYVHVPETVFALSEKPVCSFTGHLDDLLLSSSMDKTVRLWDLESKTCLKLFAHNDYVTCIQFNPMNDDYFISGSLDAKVRIWSIPERHVVDWTDLHEMVTAACYTPDGQFSPTNPSEVLVTSADSRIRILDGSTPTHKFIGFRNTSSQIAASFSQDGKYIISASEDSQVYIWRCQEQRNGASGKRSLITARAYEQFQCRDVSVAIPWPGTIRGEIPTVSLHSKRNSKRCTTSPLPTSNTNAGGTESPTKDENSTCTNSKRNLLPPLPKKNTNTNNNNNNNNNNYNLESSASPPEEELEKVSRTESGIGDSFGSDSASIRYGDSISATPTPSSNWSSSWSWFDLGASHGNHTIQATAWGLVIVTAGLGGEIRAYQNFGLPRKVGRQTNLFGGPT
ncbi:hypothetical protein FEM48_Zijuj11G0091500 [Ziziphus jujuba var. spinosa]|uniref:WD repeat-containing protein 44 n=1 Tax=Ziziphus jujuba var. spinosa TaxID=714518 RepID=A0A978UI25_ZIZJJ|nr:hypothetical protein FEM48_Zijuj11G0091500 [Ziziphus jujuba var. spinosa]